MSQAKTTNWSTICAKMSTETKAFAKGEISGREFYRYAQINQIGGEVRSLLRERGVDEARVLARKAINRRK